jgi:hypothetical protein
MHMKGVNSQSRLAYDVEYASSSLLTVSCIFCYRFPLFSIFYTIFRMYIPMYVLYCTILLPAGGFGVIKLSRPCSGYFGAFSTWA